MSVLVGRKAPNFTVPAVKAGGHIVDSFDFHSTIDGKYALLFFYPLDFTFVCPSELIALDKRMNEFKKRGVEVVACSIDSHFTHNAWVNTPVNQGGIGKVNYTIAADITHSIAQAYGIEHPDVGVALRAAFIIDRDKKVRSQLVNDLPLGRNIDEIIRLIDALQFTDEHGEVCPAGWQQGDKGMQASPEGVKEYLAANEENL
jgi:peroxiredoxin (alkyl hydroperoxide reductase subunit C)